MAEHVRHNSSQRHVTGAIRSVRFRESYERYRSFYHSMRTKIQPRSRVTVYLQVAAKISSGFSGSSFLFLIIVCVITRTRFYSLGSFFLALDHAQNVRLYSIPHPFGGLACGFAGGEDLDKAVVSVSDVCQIVVVVNPGKK